MGTHSGIITLPRDVCVIAVAEALGGGAGGDQHGIARVVAAPRVRAWRELLDSFDWRLYEAGLMLEWFRSTPGARLRLWPRHTLAAPLEFAMLDRPRLLDDLPAASLRRQLAPILDVRALRVQAAQGGMLERLDLFDVRDKVVARVELWRMPRARSVLARVLAVRGFQPQARRVVDCLGTLAGEASDTGDPIWALARRLPVPPAGYPSWTATALDPGMRADDGVQCVLRHYARIMSLNVGGAREHLDPEFVHDFRVGLRRSRALLRRLPAVFPAARLRPHLHNLAWLGHETTITRDADVHALVFPDYAATIVEPELAHALAPVWALVQQERQAAHERLTALFDSARFQRRWAAWMRFLERPAPRASRQSNGPRPLREVATLALYKAARRVRRAGAGIATDSPASAYHDLRKDCKILRYVIDAFGSISEIPSLRKATRRLKTLQDVLGEYQDLDVHREALRSLYDTAVGDGRVGAQGHTAMRDLLAELDARAGAARARFGAEFEAFLAVKLERAARDTAR